MDMRERAEQWLIEHNHHGCHVDVDPNAVVPLSADVDSLTALLKEADAEGRRYWSPADDVMATLEAVARVDVAPFSPSRAERTRLGGWLDAVREPR